MEENTVAVAGWGLVLLAITLSCWLAPMIDHTLLEDENGDPIFFL